MKQYYLAMCSRKNPLFVVARAIEMVEDYHSSHCEIVCCDYEDFSNGVSYGSVFPKSRKISVKELKELYEVKIFIPLRANKEIADDFLDKNMGITYSFGQILLAGIKILAKGSISWLSYVKPNLSKYLICTELAGNFMKDVCGYQFDVSSELLTMRETEQIALKNLLKD